MFAVLLLLVQGFKRNLIMIEFTLLSGHLAGPEPSRGQLQHRLHLRRSCGLQRGSPTAEPSRKHSEIAATSELVIRISFQDYSTGLVFRINHQDYPPGLVFRINHLV
jgi:hypothetical protein